MSDVIATESLERKGRKEKIVKKIFFEQIFKDFIRISAFDKRLI